MALSNLTVSYISSSFQNLVQVSSSGELYDVYANKITNLTASYISPTFISASAAASGFGTGGSSMSASYAATASYISPTFISASAAASGFGTGGSSMSASYAATASYINPAFISTSVTVSGTTLGIVYNNNSKLASSTSPIIQKNSSTWTGDGGGIIDLSLFGSLVGTSGFQIPIYQPSAPKSGSFYFDCTLGQLKIWDGSTWISK